MAKGKTVKKAKGPSAIKKLEARVNGVCAALADYLAAGPAETAGVEDAKGKLLEALRQ